MNIESEGFSIPESNFDVEITMSSSECAKLFRDVSNLSESVTIETSGGKVYFGSEGDAGKSRTSITSGTGATVNIKNDIKQIYSLRYLNMFNKAAPCSDNVRIVLTEGAPIVVCYTMESLGEIKYYLAPKKGNDEGVKKEEVTPAE